MARKKVLLRLAALVREHLEELALLESLDVGKPIRDTLRVDVPSAATTLQWYAETIDKTYGEVGPTGPDALSLVTREPIGVVAAIVPWNYPLIITAWKLGAALSTGNSVVLKPASQSPLTALRLAELAAEAGLPDGVLNVVTGPGQVIGDALARHPASTRSRSPARPRWAARCSARSGNWTSRRSRSSSAARARRSCWPTSATSRRRPPRSAGGYRVLVGRESRRGSLHRLRDAVEHGWPCPLALEEFSHGAMANAYDAGAANLPFAALRTHPGGLADVNPRYRTVTCPFTGETLVAVPALRPDVTIIHAQKADREGNVLIEGIVGVQKEAVLAARRAVVTVEEVVDSFEGGHPNACILPRWTIRAIAVVPGGAFPSYAFGYYARDNAFYRGWDEISRTREGFRPGWTST